MPVGAYAVASDTGRRRRRNEDNYVVAPPLFAVADGMGGAQAGEVASRLAAIGPRGRQLRRARGSGADRCADSGGEPPHLRPRHDRPHRFGHGHHDDGRARGRDDRRDRPRRRLPRLSRSRRADGATDRRPLARERAAEDRQALRGGGAGPPSAERDHARGGNGSGRRRRRVHHRGRGGRRVPALLRRASGHGLRRRDPRGRPRASRTTSRRPSRDSSQPRTAAAERTTSPRSRSGSRPMRP